MSSARARPVGLMHLIIFAVPIIIAACTSNDLLHAMRFDAVHQGRVLEAHVERDHRRGGICHPN